MTYTKTAVKQMLVAERKSMREKQKQSAFMKRTANIYKGMCKRADEQKPPQGLDFDLYRFRAWLLVLIGGGHKCLYCGTELSVNNFTVDHDVPISRGGSFEFDNLAPVCKSCNWQKGSLTYAEFRLILDVLKQFPPEAAADVKRRLTIGGKFSFGR